ncbi:hypothetical protein DVH05_003176 [Phytophthora capsici]|nr:hypothetical protein DVH05_003176 [Phytophthora capsici]
MPPLRALLLITEDADALVELALLQLWAATDLDLLPSELLALDGKCWRRLGLLLFASNNSLVLALVAALERVAARSSELNTRLLRRVWRSPWREHLREKAVDCHARLEREGIRSEGLQDARRTDLVAPRIVQILVTSLRVTLTSSHDVDDQRKDEDEGEETPKVMEVVDLLLSLSTTVEQTPAVAQAAAVGLQSLLTMGPHSFSALMTTHICRSTALQQYVTWLLGETLPSAISNLIAAPQTFGRAVDEEQRGCEQIYLQLLVAAAVVARPDANGLRGVRSPVFDDTAAMLQVCMLGIANSDSNVQYSALCLLCSLLALDDASSCALSSSVRLSGILISISWLLSHSVAHVAAMAATTLELIIRHSPLSDILRAVIEQGCVIIYRALLSVSSDAAVAASCRSLLNWVTYEVARQPGVVAASVQSILSSTNLLLQKNIVLTLQILAQRNAEIREALEDQEFSSDALVGAIQADDDAGLAVSLLSTCLSCCDKCSTLKIQGARGSKVFGQSNNEQQEEEQPLDDERDFPVELRCAEGESVKTTAVLLREHSNLLCGWKGESPEDGNSLVIARLSKFRAVNVQRFVDLLSLTQQDAVNALTDLQSFSTLQELLLLANTVGSAKCWHTTTSATCRIMTASNWLEIFHFASAEVRHPTLILRCIRFALQLHRSLGPCGTKQSERNDPVDQERADLASALKSAAIQLSQELFLG